MNYLLINYGVGVGINNRMETEREAKNRQIHLNLIYISKS